MPASSRDAVDGGVPTREDLDRRLDQYRQLLIDSLADLTEEEARATAAADTPCLLGIVRHTAYVEAVWFHQAITGSEPSDLGLPSRTADSWKARKADSIDTVIRQCRDVSDTARRNLAGRALDDVVHGRGPRTIGSLMTHVLSEHAWNTGQTSILRAVLLDRRAT